MTPSRYCVVCLLVTLAACSNKSSGSAQNNGVCTEEKPFSCCCNYGAIEEPVCNQGQWTCTLYYQLSQDECTDPCGPCFSPCPPDFDVKDAEEGPDEVVEEVGVPEPGDEGTEEEADTDAGTPVVSEDTSVDLNVMPDTQTPQPPPNDLMAWYRFESPTDPLVQDSSLYGHHGTASPNVQRGIKGRYGFGVRFDGAKSNIEIAATPNLDINGPITIEAWVYLDSPQDYNRMLVRKYLQYQLSISVVPEPNRVEFYSQPLGFARSDKAVNFAQWVYVAVTHDGDAVRFYINGELDSGHELAGALPTNNNALKLGGDGANNNAPNGGMDEVRIWRIIRSEQEICDDGLGSYDPALTPKCTFPESTDSP
ncbi:MAG TPA: LamG domain-containing protein [Myxococcales bacterium]|nr:LamG domain-containing protein [Myxococcales bacterium]HIN86968.1 LamG domain-containing protein [Myxococcales bacterium]